MQTYKQGEVKKYIIDVPTAGKKKLINKLKRLKSTVDIMDNGEYKEDSFFSQIWLESRMTEEQLDHCLYNAKGIDYTGIVQVPDGRW